MLQKQTQVAEAPLCQQKGFARMIEIKKKRWNFGVVLSPWEHEKNIIPKPRPKTLKKALHDSGKKITKKFCDTEALVSLRRKLTDFILRREAYCELFFHEPLEFWWSTLNR